MAGTLERSTLAGLFRNKAFWTCSLGMAMMTFAIGGMQVWMPTFLARMRGVPLADANRTFGLMTLASGILATLIGGWLGDLMLRFTRGGYYLVSAVAAAVTLPAIVVAVSVTGSRDVSGDFCGRVFSADQHRTAERGAGQFRERQHSRHGDCRESIHHPLAGRCVFSHADGIYIRPHESADSVSCGFGCGRDFPPSSCSTECGLRRSWKRSRRPERTMRFRKERS